MMYYEEWSKRWVIDLHDGEDPPEKEHSCETCQAVEELGIDACQGCAG